MSKWYNQGLLWDNFALYGSGDTTEDDMMKAGYAGAFTHNWDYPFRNGDDSINIVSEADKIAQTNAVPAKNVNVGAIEAEA